jgi:lipopolysaccharide heptosyltransferase I
MTGPRILVIRLGAMGDLIAALPAVASLKHSIPHSKITWVVEPKWSVLLEGNPYVDSLMHLDRRTLSGLGSAWRELRSARFDLAVDFQGLIKSALVATIARPERIFGFHAAHARESAASWFYSTKVQIRSHHAVERNLDLAAAAGASSILRTFPLPAGQPEGRLPNGAFVLASPLAGWGAKQWPLEYYSMLAQLLRKEWGLPLVINASEPVRVEGPMHLAAALAKPGIALYGPTDPGRHGPYGGTFTVLRSPTAVTNYKRTAEPDPSMRAITPDQVFEALEAILPPRVSAVQHG